MYMISYIYNYIYTSVTSPERANRLLVFTKMSSEYASYPCGLWCRHGTGWEGWPGSGGSSGGPQTSGCGARTLGTKGFNQNN